MTTCAESRWAGDGHGLLEMILPIGDSILAQRARHDKAIFYSPGE